MRAKKAIIAAILCLAVLLTGCVEKLVDPAKYITLGQYKGVAVTALSTEVTDEDIDNGVKTKLEAYVTYEPVTDRGIIVGDTANVDYTGFFEGETTPFEGGSAVAQDLVIGSAGLVPGFEDQLVGLTIGEVKMIDVVLPSQEGDIPASFEIKVNSIRQKIYPELTDDFAKTTLSVDSVVAFKETVKAELTETKILQREEKLAQDAWTAAIASTTVMSLPEDLVKDTRASLEAMYTSQAESYGITLEDFVTILGGMDMAQFAVFLDDYAASSVTEELLARAIAKAEGLVAEASEIDSLISYFMQQYGYTDKNTFYSQAMTRAEVETRILYEKAVQFVVENAVVTES